MTTPSFDKLRVLLLEEDPADAELCLQALETGGFDVDAEVVVKREEFEERLRSGGYDIVLSDFRLPGWTGMDALRAVRATATTTPFVVVTDGLGDALAVECIKEGANDLVLKESIARLPHVVRAARCEARAREERVRSEEQLRKLTVAVDQSPASVIITDPSGTIEYVNQRFTEVTGYTAAEAIGSTPKMLSSGLTCPGVYRDLWRTIRAGGVWQSEIQNRRKNGDLYWDAVKITPLRDDSGRVTHYLASQEDVTPRRIAELATIESEQRFRQLSENIDEVFFVVAADYSETLYINPAFEKVWGRSRASLYEKPSSFAEAVVADDRRKLAENTRRVQAGESPGELEFRIVRPDGEVRWVLAHAVPVFDAAGAVYRISGIALDITERKRAEEEVRRKEEQLRLLLESTAEGIYGLDLAGFCTFCNPAAARMLGLAGPEQLVGRNVHALSHPRQPDGTPYPLEECSICGVFQHLSGVHVEDGTFLRPDGSAIPVEYWAHALRQRGDILGVVVAFLDVTERQHARSALLESEARFRKLIETSFDAIDITQDGTIVDGNPGLGEMFGYSLDEMIGRPVLDFVADESVEAVREWIERGVEGRHELVGLRKDGRKIQIEATERTHVINGRPVRVTALRDVSQVRLLEEQYRQAQKMEAVGRLAGGVAHDFNNLLTVISSYSDVLLEDMGPSDPRREEVDAIREASHAAASLTRQLLAFSRQQTIKPRVLALEGVVSNAEKLLRRVVGEDVKLVNELSPEASMVLIDPGQVEQIVMNLAVNARDAMPKGGVLTLRSSRVEDQRHDSSCKRYAVLSVIDTGIGMDEATRSRIFEPFFTTKAVGKGTGLGLATVYGIVEQSNGFIRVESEPGKGSAFNIHLPLVEGEAETSSNSMPARPSLGESVLIVEDTPAVRTVTRQILERHGYAVLEAPNGEVALSIVAGHQDIDLLLTDVVMPTMSGHELADRFRELRPGTPVLFMSGYTDEAVIGHPVLVDDTCYLQKPFSAATLAHKVRDRLDAGSRGGQ